jgi:hypothetical protein
LKIERKEVEKKVVKIAKRKTYAVYTEGIKAFVARKKIKSGAEWKTLCQQIKEVIAANFSIALQIFGPDAVKFFNALEIEDVMWN